MGYSLRYYSSDGDRSEPFTLALFDTGSESEYDSCRPFTYPGTDVFLICFPVNEPGCFDDVATKWVPEVQGHLPGTPFLIVGTKADLRQNTKATGKPAGTGNRIISFEEGEQLAKRLKAEKYIECSAVTMTGVKAVFDQVFSL